MRTHHKITPLALALAVLAGPLGHELVAQTTDPRPAATNLTWWHPLAAAGGVGLLFAIDQPVRDWTQENLGDTRGDVADFAKNFKDPKIFAISSIGTTALGVVLGEPKVTVTGMHIATAYGLAGGLNYTAKWILGRSRPEDTPDDAFIFNYFEGNETSALPSGSAAVVWSLATTVADAVDRTPVSIVLYTGAALNSWARVYSDRHWLSDVGLGALIGVTSAKLVNGEWTVFGLRPPMIWTDGRRTGLQMTTPSPF